MDATERRIWTMAQQAMEAAVRGDWKSLASTVLDLDDMGDALASLLVWAGYAAVANASQHGIPPGVPGFVASFDHARLEQWCTEESLPDLTAVSAPPQAATPRRPARCSAGLSPRPT